MARSPPVIAVGAPIVLYVEAFFQSPYDCACYAALCEKGVEFGTSTAMLRQGQGVLPGLREQTLTARVPAIQHGDFFLSESIAIVEYLEEVFPSPHYPRLLPSGVRDRARGRQIMAWVRTELGALRRERPSQGIFWKEAAPAPLGAAAAREADELVDVAGRLLGASGEHLFGPWSIVDVDVAFALMRLLSADHPVPGALREYALRVWARPSVRAYVEHPRPPYPPVGRR